MENILKELLTALLSLSFALQGATAPMQNVGMVAGVQTGGNDWYVSATGTAQGTGNKNSPWDLDTALAHPSAVKPGDTIWLLEGNYGAYNKVFYSKLKGTQNAPIIVRAEPGKRVTIDGSINTKSSYTWYWGFEVWQSRARSAVRYTECISTNPGVNYDPSNPVIGDKFIHLILHDCSANGIGGWRGSEATEFYGNLVYGIGDYSSTENRGIYHGLYSQNVNKTGQPKIMENNIVWGGWNEGIQTYSSGDPNTGVNNYIIRGNVSFMNGALWGNLTDSYFAATGRGLKNYIFEDNVSYNGRGSRFGIYAGVDPNSNLVFRRNYLHGQSAAFELSNTDGGAAEDNVFISTNPYWKIIGNATAYDFKINNTNITMARNTYYGPGNFSNSGGGGYCDWETCWKKQYGESGSVNNSTYPSGTKIFVRPSKYESGKANITIFNWDKKPTVSVDLSNVLKSGDQYEIRDSQNYFGNPVASGTYTGGSISIPMKLTAIAQAVASPAVTHTSEEFGAFIVQLKNGSTTMPEGTNNTSGGTPAPVVDTTAPSRFGGQPSGSLNHSTTQTTLSVSTNESATCRYSTSAAAYSQMQNFGSTGASSHSTTITGLSGGTAYKYYVRCQDTSGNQNTDDYTINFSVATPPVQSAPSAPGSTNLYFEAEDGQVSSPMTTANNAQASGGKYVKTSTKDSGSVAITFSVPTTGGYYVWAKTLSPDYAKDSFFVSIDGQNEDVYDTAENTWSSLFQWTRVNGRGGGNTPLALNPRVFNLTAGSHTITFRGRDVDTHLDKIYITNNMSNTPSDSSGSNTPETPANNQNQNNTQNNQPASRPNKELKTAFDGTSLKNLSGSIEVYSGNTLLATIAFSPDSQGKMNNQFAATLPDSVDIKIVVPGYLKKFVRNVNLSNATAVDFGTLFAGDLNQDGSVGSADFILLISKWNQSHAVYDINKDGKVNSLDFSLLQKNWGKSGD